MAPRARSAARRVRPSCGGRAPLVVLAAAVAAVVAVTVAMAATTAAEDERPGEGGTFEFNLPGHGNVKATWRVADEEESRWLDRMAAEKSSSSGSAAGAGAGESIPFGDDKFSSDAYEYVADLLRQGRGGQPSHGKREKPRGYWKKVDEEGSQMLNRISAANARKRAEANGDDRRAAAATNAGDDLGRFMNTIFSGKSKQNDEEPSHVETDKEFTKFPPHDDMSKNATATSS